MPIRADFRISDSKEPLVMVVVAFLEQVLHIEKTSILDVHFETTYYDFRLRAVYFPPSEHTQEYAVTVSITPTEHLGDKIYLGVEHQAGEYLISKLLFQPGWKPAKEQAE